MSRLVPQDMPLTHLLAMFMSEGRWFGHLVQEESPLGALTLLLQGSTPSLQTEKRLVNLALGWWAWRYGDWWEAWRLLKPLASHYAEAHAWLAVLYFEDLHMPFQAAKHAQAALKARVERSPWAEFLPDELILKAVQNSPHQRVGELASSLNLKPSTAEKMLRQWEKAHYYLLQGQWPRSYQMAASLVDQSPNWWMARRLKALGAFLLGQVDEALDEVDRALRRHPDNLWLLADKTLYLAFLFREEEALETAGRVSDLAHEGLPDPLIQHVVAALAMARHDKALNRLAARLIRRQGVRRRRLPLWTWLWLAFGVLNSGRINTARRIAQGLNARGEPGGEYLRDLLYDSRALQEHKMRRLPPVTPEGRFHFFPEPHSLPYLKHSLDQILREFVPPQGTATPFFSEETFFHIVSRVTARIEQQPYLAFFFWHMALDIRVEAEFGEDPFPVLMGNMIGGLALLLRRPECSHFLRELTESPYGDLLQRLGWAWALWVSGSLAPEQPLALYHERFARTIWVKFHTPFPCPPEVQSQVQRVLGHQTSLEKVPPGRIRRMLRQIQALYEAYPQCTILQEIGAQLLLGLDDPQSLKQAREVLDSLWKEERLSTLGYRLLLILTHEEEDPKFFQIYEKMVQKVTPLSWSNLVMAELMAFELQYQEATRSLEEDLNLLASLLEEDDEMEEDKGDFFLPKNGRST